MRRLLAMLLFSLMVGTALRAGAQSTDQMNEANSPLTPKITVNLQDSWIASYKELPDSDSNAFLLRGDAFDPFPFILLNLLLSCLAAIQAPIILMSQNRQESKDRLRAEHDYVVNLKAELEIRLLHTKLDQLLTHHWRRLLEIQQLQVDLIEDLGRRGSS